MITLPQIFEKRMRDSLGPDFEQFQQALIAPPVVSLRRHPLKLPIETSTQELVPWHSQGRYLPQRPVFTLDPDFHAGAYYVQEASSMFLRQAVEQSNDLSRPLNVLDLCAAPGGKSTLLADLLGADSLLVANETIQSRVPVLRENLERWGFPNLLVSNHDPSAFEPLADFFDLVLVDAPCSGEGLFRKTPLSLREWSPHNLEVCEARQRRILGAALHALRPGGTLIYSTCTFNPKENEEMAAWLLQTAELEEIPLATQPAWCIARKIHGYQFYPHLARGEGFYICCFRRAGMEGGRKNRGGRWQGDWQELRPHESQLFSSWLSEPDRFSYFRKPNGEIVALPADLEPRLSEAGAVLRRRSAGIVIGELKNRDFIPSHALALSQIVSRDIPAARLDLAAALRYLKKEEMSTEGLTRGWNLVKYRENNLGWVKSLPNRVNNYLPNERRIRMELDYAALQQE